jgi:hypothetical protein
MARSAVCGSGTTRARRKAAPAGTPSSLTELRTIKDASKKAHMYSQKTDTTYSGHLKRGRTFLAQLVRDDGLGHDNLLEPDTDAELLSKAFDNPPNQYSAVALELFLVQRCLKENLGESTAFGIHAAFIRYWDQMYVVDSMFITSRKWRLYS